MSAIRLLLAAIGTTVLAGCATVDAGLPPLDQAPRLGLGAAPPGAAFNRLPVYRLQVGDTLAIKFPLAPELNDQVTIGPDGRISTADVDNLPAAGREASEVAAELRQRYRHVLRQPQLSVAVTSYAPVPVFVGGEVVAPGEFRGELMPPTLSQAIARAGGLRTGGSARHVFVIRRGDGDRPMAYAARYDRIIEGDVAADLRLAPYDLVYVPRTSVAEAYLYFNQYVQQFLPISWGFSYQVNPYPTQNTGK